MRASRHSSICIRQCPYSPNESLHALMHRRSFQGPKRHAQVAAVRRSESVAGDHRDAMLPHQPLHHRHRRKRGAQTGQTVEGAAGNGHVAAIGYLPEQCQHLVPHRGQTLDLWCAPRTSDRQRGGRRGLAHNRRADEHGVLHLVERLVDGHRDNGVAHAPPGESVRFRERVERDRVRAGAGQRSG